METSGAGEGTAGEGTAEESSELLTGLQQDLARFLDDLLRYRMPFGRYEGAFIDELPYEYLHWFEERGGGFPRGRLGELMNFVYQTKSVGAEMVFAELKKIRLAAPRTIQRTISPRQEPIPP